MRNKGCRPAGDCCVVGGGVDATGHLILMLQNGQTVDVGQVSGAPLAVTADGVTMAGDGSAARPLMMAVQKQDLHPALPIAGVANAGVAQGFAPSGLFETADTNELIVGFGADGRLRVRRRVYAAKLTYSGTLGPIAPNGKVLIPFNAMRYNVGGAGAIGAAAGFTAPFDCIVHVDAASFWVFEAWLQGGVAGPGAGAVAAVTLLYKNGVSEEQIGIDYVIKGGATTPGGTANEFKFPSGGTDVLCQAGDVLTIRAANGQSSGNSHTVFYAYASFHVVGAI